MSTDHEGIPALGDCSGAVLGNVYYQVGQRAVIGGKYDTPESYTATTTTTTTTQTENIRQ
jgi:hypothetical protein